MPASKKSSQLVADENAQNTTIFSKVNKKVTNGLCISATDRNGASVTEG